MLHVYGGVPPAASSDSLYGAPAVAGGSDNVTTCSGAGVGAGVGADAHPPRIKQSRTIRLRLITMKGPSHAANTALVKINAMTAFVDAARQKFGLVICLSALEKPRPEPARKPIPLDQACTTLR